MTVLFVNNKITTLNFNLELSLVHSPWPSVVLCAILHSLVDPLLASGINFWTFRVFICFLIHDYHLLSTVLLVTLLVTTITNLYEPTNYSFRCYDQS